MLSIDDALKTLLEYNREVDRQDGILDIRTVLLCTNCSSEFYSFCSKKVHDVSHDNVAKHFIPKSPTELIKEYEVAYKAFIAYKKWR